MIYDGIWAIVDGELTSLDELLVSRSATGVPSPLWGGFTIATIDAGASRAVDEDGAPIESIGLGLAVLDVAPAAADVVAARLADAVGPDTAAAARSRGRGLLLEILTADLARARTHVGPTDRVELDLTTVLGDSEAEVVAVSYLFGQTLPGDPAVEVRLNEPELFRYGWNRGLLAVHGDGSSVLWATDSDATIVSSADVRAATGADPMLVGLRSTATNLEGDDEPRVLTRAAKQAILRGILTRGVDRIRGMRLPRISRGTGDPPPWPFDSRSGTAARFDFDTEEAAQALADRCPDVRCALTNETPTLLTSTSTIAVAGGVLYNLEDCGRTAARLNAGNDAGGVVELALVNDENLGDLEELEDALRDSGGLGGAQPVGCLPEDLELPELPAAVVWGDPHHFTLDGTSYGMQAAGEFLLFEQGDVVVQSRTEPLNADADGFFSRMTAVAASVDGVPVSMRGDGRLDGRLHIDGELVELPRGSSRAVGRGEIAATELGWTLVWPDGTLLRVNNRGPSQVLALTPTVGPGVGMIGFANGDPADDFMTRDGTVLPRTAPRQFAEFYATYIESWRIDADESLFHYDPGESTETFTIRPFPKQAVSIDDLPADEVAAAEDVCRAVGIQTGFTLEACIIDVVVTGNDDHAFDSGFAETAWVRDPLPLPRADDVEGGSPSAGTGRTS